MALGSPGGGDRRTIAQNRKARRDYFIEDRLEAGIALSGSEVKSLRNGKASIAEAYATEHKGEFYLVGAHIADYAPAGAAGHAPTRRRKLLLHRRQIDKLAGVIQAAGMTVVPLALYFNDRGIAKVELGIARGKRQYDKRATEKARDWQRQKERLLRDRS